MSGEMRHASEDIEPDFLTPKPGSEGELVIDLGGMSDADLERIEKTPWMIHSPQPYWNELQLQASSLLQLRRLSAYDGLAPEIPQDSPGVRYATPPAEWKLFLWQHARVEEAQEPNQQDV